MSAIFQSFRSDGSIQFDASIPPYCVVEKLTLTTTTVPFTSIYSPSAFYVPMNYGADEIIAIRADGVGYARYADINYQGQWSHIYLTDAYQGTQVTVYRCRMATGLTGYYGAGLELFDASGQRTFHSGMRPVVVAGILSGIGSQISLAPGRTYASVAQTNAGYSRTFFDGSRSYEYDDKGQHIASYWDGVSLAPLFGVKWDSPNTARLVEVEFASQSIRDPSASRPPDGQLYYNEIENVLLIDVTGI